MTSNMTNSAHKKTPYFYGAFNPSGGEGARTPDLIHAMEKQHPRWRSAKAVAAVYTVKMSDSVRFCADSREWKSAGAQFGAQFNMGARSRKRGAM